MIAIVLVLGLLLLAVLAAWLYRERENARERSALADRIQSPFAVQQAAMEQVAHPSPEPPPDIYTEELARDRHHDLALQTLLGEDTE